jgi:hypothetical protein
MPTGILLPGEDLSLQMPGRYQKTGFPPKPERRSGKKSPGKKRDYSASMNTKGSSGMLLFYSLAQYKKNPSETLDPC